MVSHASAAQMVQSGSLLPSRLTGTRSPNSNNPRPFFLVNPLRVPKPAPTCAFKVRVGKARTGGTNRRHSQSCLVLPGRGGSWVCPRPSRAGLEGPGLRAVAGVFGCVGYGLASSGWAEPAGGVGGRRNLAGESILSSPPVTCWATTFFPSRAGEGWIGTGRGCTTQRRAPPPGPPTPPPRRSAAAGRARCTAGRARSSLRCPAARRSLERNAPSFI